MFSKINRSLIAFYSVFVFSLIPTCFADPCDDLVKAAVDGNTEKVLNLINSGVKVNCRVIFHWTPLFYAARAGRVAVVETLLNHGADTNIRDFQGNTLLNEVTRLRDENATLIRDLLIKKGKADVNGPGYMGRTPLLEAAFQKNIMATREYLSHGADVHYIDRDGNTALHLIVQACNLRVRLNEQTLQDQLEEGDQIARELINHGINLKARNLSGKTAHETIQPGNTILGRSAE